MISKLEESKAARAINAVFESLFNIRDQGSRMLLESREHDGKLFELRVLSWLLSQLRSQGYDLFLRNGDYVKLHSSPTTINSKDAHFSVEKDGIEVAKIWNNVQFVGVGFERACNNGERTTNTPVAPDYHELDIAVVHPQVSKGFAPYNGVFIAIECKDRYLPKGIIREALGLRRELSYLHPADASSLRIDLPNVADAVTQNPPTKLLLCTSWPVPHDYDRIAGVHAITVQRVR